MFDRPALKRLKRLSGIAQETVIQGFDHDKRIQLYYETLVRAARAEFREDNDYTLAEFLKELHERALDEVLPHYEGRIYPCAECGVFRTKSEGGTTFTVCDECWDSKPKEKDS